MTFQEFVDVIKYVQKHNSPFVYRKPGHPTVKYMDPCLDMRTNTVFAITLRGFGNTQAFHCVNECRDLPQTLKERVLAYLTNGESTAIEVKPALPAPGEPTTYVGPHGQELLDHMNKPKLTGCTDQVWTREELERGRAM
jgi:hypothetical protein